METSDKKIPKKKGWFWVKISGYNEYLPCWFNGTNCFMAGGIGDESRDGAYLEDVDDIGSEISLYKTYNEDEQIAIKRFKYRLQSFFNDYHPKNPATVIYPISALQITDLDFTFNSDKSVLIFVTLCSPGLLIGAYGKTLNALEKFLSSEDQPVHIRIIESKLWN